MTNSGDQLSIFSRIGDQEGAISDPEIADQSSTGGGGGGKLPYSPIKGRGVCLTFQGLKFVDWYCLGCYNIK